MNKAASFGDYAILVYPWFCWFQDHVEIRVEEPWVSRDKLGSECNYSKLTFDGVDRMGERLAGEVLDVVKRWPEVRKISFVAHSLGGLVARYAIGRLYELFPKMETAGLSGKCSSREHLNELTQHPDQHFEARVAGLEPMNFVTFATPHLGSRGHRQLPFLCGLPFLERSAPQTAHLFVGRSGKHLFLTDNDEGKRPLLVQMVNDSNDVKFMSALRSFKRRVAYANANYDYVVGWRTSSIRRQHELPKSNLLVKDEKYPHVVYVEQESMEKIHNGTSSMVEKQASDLEEEMVRGLTQVPWERVDVSFHETGTFGANKDKVSSSSGPPSQHPIFAEVKSYWLNSDGADVVLHMIDNFLL
ncbi:alpha/beta-Hydrolases superfamily protein [Actinidia rufa]|uniref:Alpha/beta-Hydrolases superfamily protein n=1 Tax=Actinidia rufa TaxID=165716 RepID=A0A7J0DIQ0_9ERIC|nr:alpha/beta-Hydrolases superfamily protein [Actinidia rufa]